MKLVECVPNFSQGQDQNIIDAITGEIESTEGVTLLDVDPGKATNRTVVTMIGSPEGVKEAAFKAIKRASQLIDMSRHKGEHARMGATDVCPFVPVSEVTMEECIRYARELGKRVADELSIPVYLYEEAATSPQRRNLADIRKGEYEALPDKMKDPDFKPDFGEAKFNAKSGATVIGARKFLIAYNVNLNTKDSKIASQIAKNIREMGKPKKGPDGKSLRNEKGEIVRTPGTLKACKATGWYIDEYKVAQISMNLVDYHVTPPHIAYEECKREAEKLGAVVTGSELVGVIPKEAMVMAGNYYLEKMGKTKGVPENETIFTAIKSMGLEDITPFDPKKKIIEYMILDDSKALVSMRVRDFVDELSSDSPAPGGGSTAALCGALSVALSAMVANLTTARKEPEYDKVSGQMKELGIKAQAAKDFFVRSVDEDTEAFNKIIDCFRMPKKTPQDKEKRNAAIQEATKKATLVPLSVLERALEAAKISREVATKGFKNSLSDAGVACACAKAAAQGAYLNVIINLQSIEDSDFNSSTKDKAIKLKKETYDISAEIENFMDEELKV